MGRPPAWRIAETVKQVGWISTTPHSSDRGPFSTADMTRDLHEMGEDPGGAGTRSRPLPFDPDHKVARSWLLAALILGLAVPLTLILTDSEGLALKLLTKGNLYVESSPITTESCSQNALDDNEERCMIVTLSSSLPSEVDSIATIAGQDLLHAVVASEAVVREGEQTVGRRVGMPAGPIPLASTSEGRRLLASATEWAAGPGGDKYWRALLVMSPTAPPADIETAVNSLLDALGPRWEVKAMPTSEAEDTEPTEAAFDVVLLGHGYGDTPIPESVDLTSTPVVTWSFEGWNEFISLTAGTWRHDQLSIDAPEHAMVQGLYGPQATSDQVNTRSWWGLGAVWIVSISFTVVSFIAFRREAHYRGSFERDGSPVKPDALPATLRFALTYEDNRRSHWALGVRWLCIDFAVLATAAVGLAMVILSQDRGREPDIALPPSVTGGLTWAALGILIVAVTSLWFSYLNLKPFRRLLGTANSAAGGKTGSSTDQSANQANESSTQPVPSYFNTSPQTRFGLCISGGGIRAAAFGLGGIQALQGSAIWSVIDRLTAVSGGAYTATSYALFKKEGKTTPYRIDSDEMSRLRNNTHYLAPGVNGAFRALTEWLTGLFWNLALVFALIWVAAVLSALVVKSQAYLPQLSSFPDKAADLVPFISWSSDSPSAGIAFGILLVLAAVHMLLSRLKPLLGLERLRNVSEETWKEGNRRITQGLLFAFLALIILLGVIPRALQIGDWVGDLIASAPALFASISGLLGIAWVASILRGLVASRGALIAQRLAGLILPLALVALFIWSAWVNVTLGWTSTMVFLALSLVVIAISRFLPARRVSLHDFYSDRLVEGFATRGSESIDTPLAMLDSEPNLYVGAVANIGPGPVTPPGRAALPWTFNNRYTGLESDGSREPMLASTELTSKVTAGASEYALTAMRAVAISGAAFSPAMGRRTLRSFRALMAVLNFRLGVWLPNPLFRDLWTLPELKNEFSRTPGQFPSLLKEALGLHRPDAAHLYVTDGGHYDNLGLLSLLRQGYRNIICFDASADGDTGFTTIADAMMLARAEMGIEIDLDPERDGLWPVDEDAKFVESSASVVKATMTFEDSGHGHLIYCRASLTESTPWSIDSYRRRDASFPNTSTLKQLYGDETFEAYRSLGFTVGKVAESSARFLLSAVPAAPR